MPLIDLFFDQVFVDFLQLRAKLLDPPGSSLDPSYLLYKFFVEYFMKPKSDAARDKLLQDYNSSTVPWGPLNFDPQPVRLGQHRSWITQWLEEKEKKKALEKEKAMEEVEVVKESLPPTERESDWAILNREMSSHYDPSRYWFWKWLDEEEEKKERCAAEGRVYVDPTKPRPELEPARGDVMLTRDNTLVKRERYYRPSHPIYKEARIKYYRKHRERSILGVQYLTDAELKAQGFEYVGYVPLAEKLAGRKMRQNFESFMSSRSMKQGEEVVEMSLAEGEEEEGVEEEVAEEENDVKEDDEGPFVAEEEFDVKEEEECDEWPSVEEEEFDVKEEEEHDELPSIQDEEYEEEDLDRSSHEEQTQEEEDVERPLDEEENVEEAVRRPLVDEEENFKEDDLGKRKDKRWWWRPSWILNKSSLVLALLILALFCGLCFYSSSSATYQKNGVGLSLKIHMSLPHPSRFGVDKLISKVASVSIQKNGVGLSLKIHMSLPHPSRFRVDKLISKVASSPVHIIIQSSRLPSYFMYLADSNYDGWVTPT